MNFSDCCASHTLLRARGSCLWCERQMQLDLHLEGAPDTSSCRGSLGAFAPISWNQGASYKHFCWRAWIEKGRLVPHFRLTGNIRVTVSHAQVFSWKPYAESNKLVAKYPRLCQVNTRIIRFKSYSRIVLFLQISMGAERRAASNTKAVLGTGTKFLGDQDRWHMAWGNNTRRGLGHEKNHREWGRKVKGNFCPWCCNYISMPWEISQPLAVTHTYHWGYS